MNITTTTGLVGFLLALSAFNLPKVQSKTVATDIDCDCVTIEQRLNRISLMIREQENNLPQSAKTDVETEIAGAWGNGRGRGWADGRSGGGWADGRGRGWADGGNGGGFWNRR